MAHIYSKEVLPYRCTLVSLSNLKENFSKSFHVCFENELRPFFRTEFSRNNSSILFLFCLFEGFELIQILVFFHDKKFLTGHIF